MEQKTKQILIASATGLAVGAIAGLLFAPAKGSETRAAIGQKAVDIKDYTVDKAVAVKDKAVSLKNAITNKVQNVDSPAEILDTLKTKIDKSLTNGKSSLKKELVDQIQTLEASLKS